MRDCFTHYWQNSTWSLTHKDDIGRRIDHTAGNEFRRRGVKKGDVVYIVTNSRGTMFLAGRMTVDAIVGQREAERMLGKAGRLWGATEHLVSSDGTVLRSDRPVPVAIVRRLRFGDDRSLVIDQHGRIDKQSLRGVRRLTSEAARLLDEVLGDDIPELPELRRIANVEDLAENFAAFQRGARRHQNRVAKILPTTRYWVHDTVSGAFGPGKFLGYRRMSFDVYEQGRLGETTGVKFDGTVSRRAIESATGMSFGADDGLREKLMAWGESVLGPGAHGGANPSKWRFISLAVPGRGETSDYPDEVPQPERYPEGASRTVSVNRYERSDEARAACIGHYGTKCAACGMSFEEVYGEVGRDFIHVHHLRPLSEIGEEYEVDPVEDLRPVCPNCHAMIHKETPPTHPDVLKARLAVRGRREQI